MDYETGKKLDRIIELLERQIELFEQYPISKDSTLNPWEPETDTKEEPTL